MQKRTWLDTSNANPHFSFVEFFCCYFDDLRLWGDGYTSALSEGMVSEKEVAAVALFHRISDAYESPTDDYDHYAILSDPLWLDVVTAAVRAQNSLADLINDPQERRALLFP